MSVVVRTTTIAKATRESCTTYHVKPEPAPPPWRRWVSLADAHDAHEGIKLKAGRSVHMPPCT